MNGESTPWRVPKPHPMAFASTGALQRKHRPAGERMSMPVLATPDTPSKKERSKFIIPENISPFALSPHQLVVKSKIPQSAARNSTKLSASFNAMSDNDFLEPSSGHCDPSTRSSSPVNHLRDSRIDDVFGHMDVGPFLCPDDPFGPDYNHDTHSGGQNLDTFDSPEASRTHSLPWKSPHAVFFTPSYFRGDEWRNDQFASYTPVGFETLITAESVSEYFETSFDVLEIMGHGSFSDVFKVRRKLDGLVLALKRSKVPFTGVTDKLRRLQEVENMWLTSSHPHCIQILESWEQHGYLYILMELCDNGSLRDVIDYMTKTDARFTEYQIWQILLQIASGLEHIHRVNIVHLDVKPANVLIDQQGVLKIGDFGLSMRTGSAHDPDMEGDKYYMAPETLEGRYDKPADIFSLGLLILELAADVELPAQGASWQNLRHGDYSELSFDDVSDALNQLIKDMTDPDPFKRPIVQEVLRRAEAFSERLL
jgi:hypothetical protein